MTLIDIVRAAAGPTAADDAEELGLRHTKLRAAMAESGLDALIAYAPAWRRENVRYLTDTSVGGAGAFVLLPLDGEAVAFTTRLADLVPLRRRGWVRGAELVSVADLRPLVDEVRALGAQRIGVGHLELLPTVFDGALREGLPGVELVSASKLFDAARMVKSEWELNRMRQAAKVSDAAWRTFVEVLEPGITEYDIVAEVESEIKRLGAEDNFMLIASGRDEVLGMTPPSRRLLQEGDLVRTELTPQTGGTGCRSVAPPLWASLPRSSVDRPSSSSRRPRREWPS
ncbi:hypothetical protein GCM10025866_09590 [Naasia aerilata]|uniref:Creatinase N-terminal domain-containing protein n=1 Tax=Naasia aerilata TaxID=1162966 RepID=A0ABN6XN42_9MICO|nr:aminopeptidase P family N-terminal domain-containing protein [Naasia aerilata]BDZ45050.1 hypothetical protein GCM10025866_09590 [Naasia aerilata]